jgi:AP-1 complex subunit mu
VTKKNSNVTLILFYLYKLTTVSLCEDLIVDRPVFHTKHPLQCARQVFKDYFGELEEESIRDNFVVVYELMDETMDFGYPQTCESKILRE